MSSGFQKRLDFVEGVQYRFNMIENLLREMAQSVIDGKKEKCEQLTQELLNAGLSAKEILDRGLVPGMDVVGVRFRDNIIFVPEVLISARTRMRKTRPKRWKKQKYWWRPLHSSEPKSPAGDYETH
jgi:methanogenic corrinoid protein MtbC1